MVLRMWSRLGLLTLLLLAGAACSVIRGTPLERETVVAACGLCIFGQPSSHGCYWAIEWEGEYYPVNGGTPEDHDAHGPQGMCTMPRKAVVSGLIRGGQLLTDEFELLPVDPNDVPATPPAHTHKH